MSEINPLKILLILSTGRLFSGVDIERDHTTKVTWKTAHRYQRLFAGHLYLVKAVVESLNAAW